MYHWNKYKEYNRAYHEQLDKAEADYNKGLRESLSESKNTKIWWSTVNNILGKGNNQTYPPLYNSENQTYVYDSKDKAHLFNSIFLSHSNIDDSVTIPEDSLDPDAILDQITVSEGEVRDLISILQTNKATGHDQISAKILKAAGESIVPSLTRLFQLCLRTNRYPNEWKKANVIPLHKKDDKNNCNNYRPVSILPTVSKIFERIIFKNVYNFFHDNNLITVHQSGFRPNDSTVNQLAYLYHTFCHALDDKKYIKIVYCDISKAFDRVCHKGLIFKLKQIGIRGNLLLLFMDYLKGRTQRVMIKGQYSSWGSINAGVPQGSVLGPILFLVYINDLVKSVTCGIKLFADDTVLYVMSDDVQQSSDQLNENLSRVNDWAKTWLVQFNPTKTKLMNISLKQNAEFDNYPICFDNHIIENVNVQRHIGLDISSDLKWTSHVNRIVESVSKMCDVMMKLKYKLDRSTLEKIYLNFVRPKLEYANIVWDDCAGYCKDKIENVQLLCARIVTGAKRGTHHDLLYKELQWQTLSERRHVSKLKFMYKLKNRIAPEYLSSLLPNTRSVNVLYNLRHGEDITRLKSQTQKVF